MKIPSRLQIKIISLTMSVAFFFTAVSLDALAPAPGSRQPAIRLAMERMAYEAGKFIIFPQDAEDVRLLRANNADALLVTGGKMLVAEQFKDPGRSTELMRLVTHESIEGLMQALFEKDKNRYLAIKDLIFLQREKDILSAYLEIFPGRDRQLPPELLLNDIIAKTFELVILVDEEKLISHQDISPEEERFMDLVAPLIYENRFNYFTEIFWEMDRRMAYVRTARTVGRGSTLAASVSSGEMDWRLMQQIKTGSVRPVTGGATQELIYKTIDFMTADIPKRLDKKHLKSQFQGCSAVKVARGVNWDKVGSFLREVADQHKVFITTKGDLPFVTQSLGNEGVVLSEDIVQALFPILLAKEACTLYTRKNNPSAKPFDTEKRGFLVAFALYSVASDSDRNSIDSFYSTMPEEIKKRYGFLKIFKDLYSGLLKKPSTNVEIPIERYLKGAYDFPEEFGLLGEDSTTDLPTISEDDLRNIFEPEFLGPAAAEPFGGKDAGAFRFTRDVFVGSEEKKVELRIVPPDSAKDREIISMDFSRTINSGSLGMEKRFKDRIVLKEISDEKYGSKYQIIVEGQRLLDYMRDLRSIGGSFGELAHNWEIVRRITDYVGLWTSFVETKAGSEREDVQIVLRDIHGLLGFVRKDSKYVPWDAPYNTRGNSCVINFITDKGLEESHRKEAVRKQEEIDRKTRHDKNPFSIEYCRVTVSVDESDFSSGFTEETTRHAKELVRALKKIGFKDVELSSTYGTYRTSMNFDVIIFLSPRGESGPPAQFKLSHPRIKVFEWADREMYLSEITKHDSDSPSREVYGIVPGRDFWGTYKLELGTREDRLMGRISPEVAAEFVARRIAKELDDKKEPIMDGSERITALPSYVPAAEIPTDPEERLRRGKEMQNLLQVAESFVHLSSEMERMSVEASRFVFTKRPMYQFDNGRPFLIFEDVGLRGAYAGLGLKEDDEVEITFDGDSTTWRAVVIEADEGRIVTSTPRSFNIKDELKDPKKHNIRKSGSIKKRYNSAPADAQLEFLRNVALTLEHKKAMIDNYPILAAMFGITDQKVTPPADRIDLIALSNMDIKSDESQLRLISAGLNGGQIELGWGPPGTGKTTVASELQWQNSQMGKSQFVAAQTNRAVDNMLLAAKEQGLKVYRLGQHMQVIDPRLHEDCICNIMPKKPEEPEDTSDYWERKEYREKLDRWREKCKSLQDEILDDIRSGRAILGGTCVGMSIDPFMKNVLGQKFKFDRAIIEEASVASFAELLPVLGRIKEKVLMIGDHKQLGLSPMERELRERLSEASFADDEIDAMDTSLFEYLLEQKTFNMTMLMNCYRMTPLLVELINFNYDDKLIAMRDVPEDANRASLIVVDTKNIASDRNIATQRGTSWFNEAEGDIVMAMAEALGRSVDIDASALGLITPYNAQIRSYRDRLRALVGRYSRGEDSVERLNHLLRNVGTVWPFQGREKPVIMVSSVRSEPTHKERGREVASTGFVSWKMWNVMDSRAQECLIVTLNSDTFCASRKDGVADFTRHMMKLAKTKGVYKELSKDGKPPGLSEEFKVLDRTLRSSPRYKVDVPFLKARPAGATTPSHADGHVATFFERIYDSEPADSGRTFNELRNSVRIKGGRVISKSRAMRDLSQLVKAGVVERIGRGENAEYIPLIKDEEIISRVHEALCRLPADVKTVKVQDTVLEVIAKVFTTSLNRMRDASPPTNDAIRVSEEYDQNESGKSIILFVEDMLKHAAVMDMEDTIRKLSEKRSVLTGGKIVLFAKDRNSAVIVSQIIERASFPRADIVIITEEELVLAKGAAKSESGQIEDLIDCARAKGASDILAVMKSRSEKSDGLADLCDRLKIPIVIMGLEEGIYSFAQALAKAIEAKIAEGRDGWIVILPPIARFTDEIRKEYERYQCSLSYLKAA